MISSHGRIRTCTRPVIGRVNREMTRFPSVPRARSLSSHAPRLVKVRRFDGSSWNRWTTALTSCSPGFLPWARAETWTPCPNTYDARSDRPRFSKGFFRAMIRHTAVIWRRPSRENSCSASVVSRCQPGSFIRFSRSEIDSSRWSRISRSARADSASHMRADRPVTRS
ncbi:hypothetical protein LUX57_01505 [Actinomadura madurae]|uniref:hypothetical protein n=1 Tax=Actinomadura madurae TaxID=1993 RepID=UPI0020D220FE|nr:hypothetical protein [Actinomadura madurae]MCP9964027.1 hypothetical protein [Actinomadura madurae]